MRILLFSDREFGEDLWWKNHSGNEKANLGIVLLCGRPSEIKWERRRMRVVVVWWWVWWNEMRGRCVAIDWGRKSKEVIAQRASLLFVEELVPVVFEGRSKWSILHLRTERKLDEDHLARGAIQGGTQFLSFSGKLVKGFLRVPTEL